MSESTPEVTLEVPVTEKLQTHAFAALEARLSSLEAEHAGTCRTLSGVEAENADTRRKLSGFEADLGAARRKLRSTWVSGVVLSVGLITIALNPASRAQVGVTLNSLNTRVTTLETKTAYMTVQAASTSGNNTGQVITRFSGCNVQIDNGNTTTNSAGGAGSTTSATGTGNLILGFDEAYNSSTPNTLTGSHNLIIGEANSYSSYGGIVMGSLNLISGPYAAVIGGDQNKAKGFYDVVVSGEGNIADSAVVNGNQSAVVVGGYGNMVTAGSFSSIFGGADSTISSSGYDNSIVGGYSDKITGNNSNAVLIGVSGSTSNSGSTYAKY